MVRFDHLKKLDFFKNFEVSRNGIFNIMLNLPFLGQKCHTFCHRSKSLNKFTLFCNLIYLLGVFQYFGHDGRHASQIFNPLLFFNYFNPTIILIKKKLCLRRFKVWFGIKAAKIGNFWHLNFTFSH